MIIKDEEHLQRVKKTPFNTYQETPIEESMKYFHLRNYLINAKRIREGWKSSKEE
jgi:hypothetical protein